MLDGRSFGSIMHRLGDERRDTRRQAAVGQQKRGLPLDICFQAPADDCQTDRFLDLLVVRNRYTSTPPPSRVPGGNARNL